MGDISREATGLDVFVDLHPHGRAVHAADRARAEARVHAYVAGVAVGIVWQLCLTALPVYLVLREWPRAAGIALALGVTSVFLKFNWYDKLEKN